MLLLLTPLSEVPLMKTKTEKTSLVTTEAYGLTSCPSAPMSESKLSHRSEVQSGFVPKLSHPSGKNTVPLRSTEKPFRWLSLDLSCFSAEGGVFASEEVVPKE